MILVLRLWLLYVFQYDIMVKKSISPKRFDNRSVSNVKTELLDIIMVYAFSLHLKSKISLVSSLTQK